MSHQPFETWIVEGSPLSNTQDKELREHLQTCPKCSTLESSLREVEWEIRTLPVKQAKPGFTGRWKELAIERQARALEQQSRRLLFGMAVAVGILMMMAALYFVLKGSPMNWLIEMMETGVETFVGLRHLQHTILSWMRTVPVPIQLAIWIPITTIFSFLGLTWVVALWRIPTQGVQAS